MQPIPNWENIVPQTGDFEPLKPGAYICQIINVAVMQSKSGNAMLKFAIDICEGEHQKHFREIFETRQKFDSSAKWPAGGVYYQMFEGGNGAEERFKGLIETLEAANPMFKWINCNWNEKRMIGLKFGGIFREEEYLNSKDEVRTSVRLYRVVPIEGLFERKIPEIKRLKPTANNGGGQSFGIPAREEDIPF